MKNEKEIKQSKDNIPVIYLRPKNEEDLSSINLEEVFKPFSAVAAHIQESFQPIQERLQSIIEGLSNFVNTLHEQSVEAKIAIDSIVENGWFINPNSALDLIEIVSLKDLSHQELNKFFEDYYELDDSSNLKMLFENLNIYINEFTTDERFKKILSECIEAYDKGLYIVSINSLFAVIEGLLYEYFYNQKGDVVKNRKAIESMENKIKEMDSLLEFAYLSVVKYLYESFKYAKFTDREPQSILNRNWFLHGKSDYEVSRLDVIKMFSLVECIFDLAE